MERRGCEGDVRLIMSTKQHITLNSCERHQANVFIPVNVARRPSLLL